MVVKKPYNIIFEESPEVLLIVAPQGQIIDINPMGCKLLGYDRNDLNGLTINYIVINAEEKEFSNSKSFFKKIINTTECIFNTRDGILIPFEVSNTKLSNGQILYSCREKRNNDSTNSDQTTKAAKNTISIKAIHSTNINKTQLEYLINNAPFAIAILDTEMNYVNCNKISFLEMPDELKALPKEYFIGKNYYDIIKNIPENWKDLHKKSLNGEKVSKNRVKIKTSNDEEVWVRWESSPWYNEEGEIAGIIKYSENISLKVKTELSLRESEKFNRSLIENTPVGIIIQNSKQIIQFVNSTAARIGGYDTVDDLIGNNIFDYITPDKKEIVLSRIHNVLNNGEFAPIIELELKKKDGTFFTSESIMVPFQFNNEPAVLSVIFDISERIKIEKHLKASEKRHKQLLDIIPDLIFINSVEGVFLDHHCSPDNLLFPSEHFLGKNVAELFDPPIAKKFLSAYKAASNDQEQLVNYSLTFLGQKEYFEARIVKYTDNSVLSIVRKVTEQVQAEEDVKNLTKDLINSNNELQQFAYLVSHDLRSPVINLSTLIGFLNIDNLSDPENLIVIEKINDSVSQLETSLNELTDTVALKKQEQKSQKKVYISKVISEVKKSIMQQIEGANANIIENIEIDEIEYPKTHIKSIIQNLLTNAIKYRKPDILTTIRISTFAKDDYLCLEISDNGLGIDLDKYKDKIFGIYQRFHDMPNSKGLGLYIVKSEVELMGGKIEVKSKVNKGTTFTIYLFKN